jgi:hypothetical protein
VREIPKVINIPNIPVNEIECINLTEYEKVSEIIQTPLTQNYIQIIPEETVPSNYSKFTCFFLYI